MLNKCLKMSKSRSDYEANHIVIRKAYFELLTKFKRKPTLAELAERTKLSMKTIDRHLEDIQFKPQQSSFRILSDDVLLSIFHSARKGSVAAQKLWLIVIEGWKEKSSQLEIEESSDEYFLKSMSTEELEMEKINILKAMLEGEVDPIAKANLNEQIKLERKIIALRKKLES